MTGTPTSLWSQVVGGRETDNGRTVSPLTLLRILMTTLTFLSGAIYLSFSFLSSN